MLPITNTTIYQVLVGIQTYLQGKTHLNTNTRLCTLQKELDFFTWTKLWWKLWALLDW